MATEKIIPFGFGSHTGRVVDIPSNSTFRSSPGDIVRLHHLPSPSEFREIARSLTARTMITPPISPYSHLASAIWCSGVQVAALSGFASTLNGQSVSLDFDRAELSDSPAAPQQVENDEGTVAVPERRAVSPTRKGPLRLFSEIGSLAEGEMALRDHAEGIGVVKIEQWAADPTGRLAAALVGLSKQFPGGDRPKIRFYDDEAGLPMALPAWALPSRGLGIRGVRALFDAELQSSFFGALESLHEEELIIILPMVSTPDEVGAARDLIGRISPKWSVGVTIETPSAALLMEQIAAQVAFVEVGLNDLSQYTLGWDRNAVNAALLPHDRIAEAVGKLVSSVFSRCRTENVTCVLGLDLRPDTALATQLMELGVDAISCAPPLVRRWREAWANDA